MLRHKIDYERVKMASKRKLKVPSLGALRLRMADSRALLPKDGQADHVT